MQSVVGKGPGPNHDYALVMNITIHNQDVWEEFPMSLESLRVDLFEPRWAPFKIGK